MQAPLLRKVVISILLGIALIVFGLILQKVAVSIRRQPERQEVAPTPLAVSAVELSRGSITEKLRGYGLANPIARASISAQVAGAIESIPAGNRVGARVKAGDVLASIDPLTYETEILRQKALLAEATENLVRIEVEIEENARKLEFVNQDITIARSELDRAENLLKQGATSESTRDQARVALQSVQQRLSDVTREKATLRVGRARGEALLEAQKNAVILAERNLAFATPKAPFDGVILERMVDAGDFVQPGSPLFVLVDSTRLEMPIEIPASQAAALREGAPAELTSDQRPPTRAIGTVERVSPVVDARNRTLGAYIVIDGAANSSIVPGTFLKASVDGRVFDDVFAIPRSAIVDGSIFLEVEGVAKEYKPDFFVQLDEVALTRDSLPDPATLILNGFEQIYDGAPIDALLEADVSEELTPPAAVVSGTSSGEVITIP